jgi:hypothetical protein
MSIKAILNVAAGALVGLIVIENVTYRSATLRKLIKNQ